MTFERLYGILFEAVYASHVMGLKSEFREFSYHSVKDMRGVGCYRMLVAYTPYTVISLHLLALLFVHGPVVV